MKNFKKVLLFSMLTLFSLGIALPVNFVKADSTSEIFNVNVSARVEGTLVVWNTSVPASSIVNYTDRVTLAESSKINDVLTTNHSILLSGLANSRSYQYSVSGKDVNGRLISSDDQRFTTLASSATGDDIPYMSYVKANPSTNNILVTWNTSVPASSIVRYVDLFQDTPSSKIDYTIADDSLITNHSILIPDLPALRSYRIYVSSKDANEYLMSTSFDGTIVKTLPSLSNSSPVDLTVTAITFSGSKEGENGTLSVTVKNLGGDLTSSQGLLNWYNNFSKQKFIFSSETPSILAYRGSRPDPTASSPLKKDESITFSWVGKFNTSGNLNLQFTVDNANELAESNENNNTLSVYIPISSRVTSNPNIKIANFKYSNNSNSNVPTQIEFDLVNNTNSSATFNLSSWDDTTNFPLKSGLYTLTANQTAHVYLMDVNNMSHLATGSNSINVKIVSADSATVYNSQDFIVIRGGDASNGNISDTPVSINPASSLADDKIGQLLAQINSLKNTIAEQANQIKYLSSLVKGTNISTDEQNTLNNFITYGSDANTKKLGAGERASVIYSYKNAFDKLPTTQAELTDVIKIANGRWPSATSANAESQAKIQFKKIYQREANMSDANDNAAVTVMAYGLKQKAENRNLNSEANGIKTFKAIYGHTPNTTEEWNIMQAITYSGASR